VATGDMVVGGGKKKKKKNNAGKDIGMYGTKQRREKRWRGALMHSIQRRRREEQGAEAGRTAAPLVDFIVTVQTKRGNQRTLLNAPSIYCKS